MDDQNQFGYDPNNQTPQQPMDNGYGQPTNGGYQQPMDNSYGQQGYPQQPNYGQPADGSYGQPNAYGQPQVTNVYVQQQEGLNPDVEKRANTVKVLGIIALITSIVCCGSFAPILAIISLVKASGLKTVTDMMSPQARSSVKAGKIMSWISIVLSIVMVLGVLASILVPSMLGYVEKAKQSQSDSGYEDYLDDYDWDNLDEDDFNW
ncbi:MAG: hypothetical protein IJ055_08610 [Oscillospiraceae bacterium]|nr:hypothetical protein [Oscillospiraceae bacterium]